MTIQERIGISVMLIGILLIADMMSSILHGNAPVLIMVPVTFKTWKFFWEK